jgi:hypothetical protein
MLHINQLPDGGEFRERARGTRRLFGHVANRVLVERHAHLAPDHLAVAASRLDPLLVGYDPAT